MAVKSRSLSVEELDLIEFLADQVALLSSSLTVKVACEDVFAESSALPSEVKVAREDVAAISSVLPLAACEAMELQSNVVVLPSIPPSVVGAPNAVVRSSTPSTVTLVQHASDVVESFKAKPPDLVALEVGLKGAALMWSRRGAWLATKSRGGTSSPRPLSVVASSARWSGGGVWLAHGRVSCVSVVVSLLLLLPVVSRV
jgi:hypothetical protein